jgi:hypothetical protein
MCTRRCEGGVHFAQVRGELNSGVLDKVAREGDACSRGLSSMDVELVSAWDGVGGEKVAFCARLKPAGGGRSKTEPESQGQKSPSRHLCSWVGTWYATTYLPVPDISHCIRSAVPTEMRLTGAERQLMKLPRIACVQNKQVIICGPTGPLQCITVHHLVVFWH